MLALQVQTDGFDFVFGKRLHGEGVVGRAARLARGVQAEIAQTSGAECTFSRCQLKKVAKKSTLTPVFIEAFHRVGRRVGDLALYGHHALIPKPNLISDFAQLPIASEPRH